ncbi:methyl-accepting chemotaxis protein [Acetoanaerobium pronyense]|uniref:Methyl-accepting chemotaxis protein n=1 Tax=Acetoanaerobium pronyense TaxID=1482736 RepID=A0ABS4KLX1_9FIRM|nr:hypothetical protein [Acetoanaerobium pronyense]MBP2028766.1 methyl-accepting chemotaxis protein [Acetoanaerobium pronyense]
MTDIKFLFENLFKKHKIILLIMLSPFILVGGFKLSPFVNEVVTTFFVMSVLIYFGGLYILLKQMVKIEYQYDEALRQIDKDTTFVEINNILNKYDDLKNLFMDFKKSLRMISNLNEESGVLKTEYYATVDVEEYFNEDSLIYKKIYSKTLNFIPQILTGLGIFGTFLGIVQGVSGLGNEMGSNEIQSAITKLLSGVEVSFRTSLYGLAFSIALTVLTKIVFDIIIGKSNKLNEFINNSLTKNIQKEGLKELEKELQKQTSSIERLATDISQELGSKIDASLDETMRKVNENISVITLGMKEVFENSIIENISPALEKLSRVSEELGNRQEQTSDKFMHDAIARIEEVISVGTQNEIEKLKLSLEVMSEKNNEYLEKFTEGMNKLDSLFSSQKELIEGTNNSVDNINASSESIQTLQSSLNILISDIGSISNKNNKSIENIDLTFEKIKNLSIEQSTVIENLAGMIDKSYEYSKLQDNYMNKIESSTMHITNSIDSSKIYIENMVSDMKSYLDNFKMMRDISGDIIEKMNLNFNNIISNLENSSEILNNNIETVNDEILNNVSDVTNEISSITKELHTFYINMSILTDRIENFSQVEETSQELWRTYKESFENLNENINEGIINYTVAIKKGTDQVFLEYDNKIANAVSQLKGLIESLNDTMESVSESFESIISTNTEIT